MISVKNYSATLLLLVMASNTVLLAAAPTGNQSAHPHRGSPASKSGAKGYTKVPVARTKSALASTDINGAEKLIGKQGSFVGVINNIYKPKPGQDIIYLNFAKSWKTTISAAIPLTDRNNFPDLSSLVGKKVMITGKFAQYDKTHPEIIVTASKQIELVVK